MRAAGGRWGLWLGVLFIMAAIGLLAVLLRSAVLRSRLKVFLAKHFYRNKYDYRDEWLRLTAGLGGTGELRVVAARGLEGLARIIGAAGADLFLLRDERRYEWIVALTAEVAAKPAYPPDHPVVRFLIERNWVIDSEEYLRDPARYDTAFGDASAGALPPHSIILPLDSGDSLLGFVVLSRPSALGALNFEDHDILRTAGRQVAVVLAQALAQEQLAETRQFEAMNKLSAFLMHDLKNVIAQHELIISNSRRCRDKPEFMDDVVTTLRSGVARMRKLLDHLQRAVATQTTGHRADVSKVLAEVRSHCADREPVPQIPQIDGPVWVRIDMDSLASVLTHLIRNAQDATPPGGTVTVELAERPDELQITVRDTGCGMDEAFIRNRLFRPFDTTKGAKGMGIGAYQVREMVRAAGGEVEVSSALGVGTTFVLRVPREAPGTACDESAA
jgi:putative PEP-CTERM system histidine kinase